MTELRLALPAEGTAREGMSMMAGPTDLVMAGGRLDVLELFGASRALSRVLHSPSLGRDICLPFSVFLTDAVHLKFFGNTLIHTIDILHHKHIWVNRGLG